MRVQEIIPVSIRKKLLKLHQNFIWKSTFNSYKNAIENNEKPSKALLKRLIYSWGNQGFSAQVDYLETCVNFGLSTEGTIVECGSGLSTLVLGVIAKHKNRKMISFEHIDFWAQKIQLIMDENQLNNILYVRKLKKYGDFEWYDIDNLEIPTIGLCICDAPPSDTLGGRRGFFNLLKDKLESNSIILVDDTIREDEQLMIEEWKKQTPMEVNFYGSFDPHAVLKIK